MKQTPPDISEERQKQPQKLPGQGASTLTKKIQDKVKDAPRIGDQVNFVKKGSLVLAAPFLLRKVSRRVVAV